MAEWRQRWWRYNIREHRWLYAFNCWHGRDKNILNTYELFQRETHAIHNMCSGTVSHSLRWETREKWKIWSTEYNQKWQPWMNWPERKLLRRFLNSTKWDKIATNQCAKWENSEKKQVNRTAVSSILFRWHAVLCESQTDLGHFLRKIHGLLFWTLIHSFSHASALWIEKWNWNAEQLASRPCGPTLAIAWQLRVCFRFENSVFVLAFLFTLRMHALDIEFDFVFVQSHWLARNERTIFFFFSEIYSWTHQLRVCSSLIELLHRNTCAMGLRVRVVCLSFENTISLSRSRRAMNEYVRITSKWNQFWPTASETERNNQFVKQNWWSD